MSIATSSTENSYKKISKLATLLSLNIFVAILLFVAFYIVVHATLVLNGTKLGTLTCLAIALAALIYGCYSLVDAFVLAVRLARAVWYEPIGTELHQPPPTD